MKYQITLLTSILLLTLSSAQAKRITCKSFDTQAESQRHYDQRKRSWKALDRDKDGEPCECLIGGSSYNKNVCVKWRKKYGKR